MPDTRHIELEAVALGGEIKLEVAVFLGIGRQFVRPYRDLAPLEAFADVPDRLQAGAPSGEVIERAAHLREPLAADPFARAALRRMAIDTGEVELPDLALRERFAALVGGLGGCALVIDRDGAAVGEKAQVDRERHVFLALDRPHMTGRRLRMARYKLLDPEHLVEPGLPARHRGRPGLEGLRRVPV